MTRWRPHFISIIRPKPKTRTLADSSSPAPPKISEWIECPDCGHPAAPEPPDGHFCLECGTWF